MSRNVQIPYELFVSLLKYHLLGKDENAEIIKTGLNQKLDALIRHELYQKYKTAPTEEDREDARQKYLNEKGVSQKFRW